MAWRHIAVGGLRRSVEGYVERQHLHLDALRDRDPVVRSESAVRIARNCAPAIEVTYGHVEVFGGLHVAEAHRAGCGRMCGRKTRSWSGRGQRHARIYGELVKSDVGLAIP